MFLRDGGCRFPGCTNHRFVEGHHIVYWADGGETRLGNLVDLCRLHHRYVHEHSYSIAVGEDGGFVFRDPRGRQIPEVGEMPLIRPDALEQLRAAMAKRGIAIDRETNSPGWDGDQPDWGMAVDALWSVAPACA